MPDEKVKGEHFREMQQHGQKRHLANDEAEK